MLIFPQLDVDSERAVEMSSHCFSSRAKSGAFCTVGVTAHWLNGRIDNSKLSTEIT